MRLKRLDLNENDVEDFGLSTIRSKELGHVIALVGENGAGKSRYLNAIEKQIKNIKTPISLIDKLFKLNRSYARDADNYQKAINTIGREEMEIRLSYLRSEEYEHNINHQSEIDEIERILADNYDLPTFSNTEEAETFESNTKQVVVDFVKKRLVVIKHEDIVNLHQQMKNPKVGLNDILDKANIKKDFNKLFESVLEDGLTFFQGLGNDLAMHQILEREDPRKSEFKKKEAQCDKLIGLTREFLDKDLSWERETLNHEPSHEGYKLSVKGAWCLNGYKFNYTDLSEGERVLFCIVLILFLCSSNSEASASESIIFFDEPELNLHPKIAMRLINKLSELIQNEGQLIIATHSLPIIANLDYRSIFMVDDNKIYNPCAPNIPKTINKLMGFENEIIRLTEFLKSPAAWAMNSFLVECLTHPNEIKDIKKNDPELLALIQTINKESVKILDFGAGQGRMLIGLKEHEEFWKKVKYDCYDHEGENEELLKSLGAKNVINKQHDLPERNYDIVSLINVLHEVDVLEWGCLLTKIKNCLKDDGHLVLIEDSMIPIGELPCDNGYIILSEIELKTLLGKKATRVSLKDTVKSDYDDRIVCVSISKASMNSFDSEIVRETLLELKKNTFREVKEFYSKEDEKPLNKESVRDGRNFARKAILHTNSIIALEKLTKAMKI